MSSLESKLQNSEIVVSKTNTSPQIFLYYYWLSSFYHHWYIKYKLWPILTQFCVNVVTIGVKLLYFEKVISEKNSSLPYSIKYWFRFFYHFWCMMYIFGPFLPNLKIMTSPNSNPSSPPLPPFLKGGGFTPQIWQ